MLLNFWGAGDARTLPGSRAVHHAVRQDSHLSAICAPRNTSIAYWGINISWALLYNSLYKVPWRVGVGVGGAPIPQFTVISPLP